jgi:hypothetical protein
VEPAVDCRAVVALPLHKFGLGEIECLEPGERPARHGPTLARVLVDDDLRRRARA